MQEREGQREDCRRKARRLICKHSGGVIASTAPNNNNKKNGAVLDKRILFEVKPDGTEIWWHTDGAFITIEHVVPVDQIIDDNKTAEAAFNRSGKLGDLVLHAELPAQMYWDLYENGVVEDRTAFKRFLNDPDNKYLRKNNLRL